MSLIHSIDKIATRITIKYILARVDALCKNATKVNDSCACNGTVKTDGIRIGQSNEISVQIN